MDTSPQTIETMAIFLTLSSRGERLSLWCLEYPSGWLSGCRRSWVSGPDDMQKLMLTSIVEARSAAAAQQTSYRGRRCNGANHGMGRMGTRKLKWTQQQHQFFTKTRGASITSYYSDSNYWSRFKLLIMNQVIISASRYFSESSYYVNQFNYLSKSSYCSESSFYS